MSRSKNIKKNYQGEGDMLLLASFDSSDLTECGLSNFQIKAWKLAMKETFPSYGSL